MCEAWDGCLLGHDGGAQLVILEYEGQTEKCLADGSWKSMTWAQDIHAGEEQELHKLFSMPEESVPLHNSSFRVKSE